MLKDTLTEIFERDLNRLINEIDSYKNESDLWKTKEGISNSGGNLCLHLLGNLNHFIGATLGNSGYVRNREAEFSLKDIPAAELTGSIRSTITVVTQTIRELNDDTWEKEFPLIVFGKATSTEYMLVHLAAHLSYHLGQINYHRRMISN